ncbi:NPCBM/NEW2 domain-containing protein [Opitutus sp. ER46]|uniref:NPCBM/NEW2 domain-containing protein n=1 Tax=Opitutus sp. ER46 TaxID=2161864 RepID=UPI000D3159CB|nr:NPCBM/NEW2 domain-containing protein [Opitutus sp. ER46]PTX96545.1 alpha-galactosidase [Opitutus sp. ER46]
MNLPRLLSVLAASGCLLLTSWAVAETVPLEKLIDGAKADADDLRPKVNRNVRGQPLRIAGRAFATGLGVQTDTSVAFLVNGGQRLVAKVGLDDIALGDAVVTCEVLADGESVWSRRLVAGQLAETIELEIAGKRIVTLVAEDAGNGIHQAPVNWVEASVAYTGEAPKAAPVPGRKEDAYILTPPASSTPRINGARVFGVRPGHPFLFTIAATGERPMRFAAEGLPAGLTLDGDTGQIRGVVPKAGTHRVALIATNARGTDRKPLRIEVGEEIALTPPLGWNSWTCWEAEVDQEKVLASARAMVTTGLAQHGWVYVNIDDTWQGERRPPTHALQPNQKFPDMKQLCADIHALGLKAGIYSTPWITSYANYAGGSADNPEGTWTKWTGAFDYSGNNVKPLGLGAYSFVEVDAKQWAEWGFDYLKYDWRWNEVPETERMAKALRASGRDIVYSLSNAAPFRNAAPLSRLANAWRTTGDIRDTWVSIKSIGFTQDKWREFARPGHWNDPDTLVVGKNGRPWGPVMQPTRLTPDEQYTQVSLWSLLAAPILIGCPLDDLDAFTLSLLTNDEVLEINQDELGRQAAQTLVNGRKQVWVKELADGSRAIGLFNLAAAPQEVSFRWAELGLEPPARVRDVWRQLDLPASDGGFVASVPRHGVILIRVWPTAR